MSVEWIAVLTYFGVGLFWTAACARLASEGLYSPAQRRTAARWGVAGPIWPLAMVAGVAWMVWRLGAYVWTESEMKGVWRSWRK